MMALGVALLPVSTVAQQKALKDQLVGSWMLDSNAITPWIGGIRSSYGGLSPKGILILDASGRYAYVTGAPDRPKFKATDNLREQGTVEEFAAAARGFGANFGTWSVDEAGKTLIRRYEIDSIPNNDMRETKAAISLTSRPTHDALTLTIALADGGIDRFLYWRTK